MCQKSTEREKKRMKLIRTGIYHTRPDSFTIDRKETIYDYTVQLFHTATDFVINGREVHAAPNTMIVYTKFFHQCFRSAENKMINSFAAFNATPGDVIDVPLNVPFPIPNNDNSMYYILSLLDSELFSSNSGFSKNIQMLLSLLLEKVKEYSFQSTHADMLRSENIFMLQLRNEIFSNPQKDWNIPDMAAQCSMSVSTLSHLYKKLFDSSPIADVINGRIILSKKLLRDGKLSIDSIADKCNFNSTSYFIRQFQKYTGKTPTQYRKQQFIDKNLITKYSLPFDDAKKDNK